MAKQKNSFSPLVAIPTTYNKVSVDELYQHGFKIIIFANQIIRASISNMERVAKLLKNKKRASMVENSVAPLEKVFDYVNLKKLQEDENRYLP